MESDLARVERKIDTLTRKVDALLQALRDGEVEISDDDLLTLDGSLAGAERDQSQPL